MHRATLLLCSIFALMTATRAFGQVPIDEAERRLRERQATKSTTQPVSEVDRLRQENMRLRERLLSLEAEVQTLKTIIARDLPTSRPATRPAGPSPAEQISKALVGRWRGGDITAGAGYLLQFDADGIYKQFFTAGPRQNGQYRVYEDRLEMWADHWPEGKRHNEYKMEVSLAELRLTALVLDGSDVKTPHVMILRRAE